MVAPPLDLDPQPGTRLVRSRTIALAALGPLVTGYAAVAALLALVVSVAPRAHFSTGGVLFAALPGWLAAYQVPLAFDAVPLGALPLLPTLGLLALDARAAAGAAERLGFTTPRQAAQVVGAIALVHGGCGVVVALVSTGRSVEVDPLAAFYYPALLAAAAATAGVRWRCGLLAALVARVDGVAVRGLAAGVVAVVVLLAMGAALVTVALTMSLASARDVYVTTAPGIGNGLGLTLLSLGYLPNAVVAAVSFVAGPGFALGEVWVSPLEFTGGPVPAVPLLAALPAEPATWWPALFVLPALVGVLVGLRLNRATPDPVTRMRGVGIATGVVAVAFVVLAGSAGGRLGHGPFDPVSMRAAAVSVALVLWIGVPAAAVAWFTGPRPPHHPAPGLIPPEDTHPTDPAEDAGPGGGRVGDEGSADPDEDVGAGGRVGDGGSADLGEDAGPGGDGRRIGGEGSGDQDGDSAGHPDDGPEGGTAPDRDGGPSAGAQ